jgi:hypothetical protein
MADPARLGQQRPGLSVPAPATCGRSTVIGGWCLLVVLLVLILTNGALVEGWRRGYGAVLGKEHGLMEDAQLALLAPTFALFWLGWRRGLNAERTAAGALAMLSAAAFVREIDVKSLGGPGWFRWLSHHGLQEILLVAMTLPILVYLALKWRHWLDLLKLAFAPTAISLYIAGILLMFSVYLDRRVVTTAEMRFWEELVELNGYAFLLLAAWIHWRIVQRKLRIGLGSSDQHH